MTDFASPAPRNASAWIRQIHRWLSILFTLSVIATVLARALPDPLVWVSYIPLAPLFLLMATGVTMFALPYIARRRGAR